MEQEELTQQFSALQIGVFNSALDAAIRKAKLFVGELIPDEKKAVIEKLEKLKINMVDKKQLRIGNIVQIRGILATVEELYFNCLMIKGSETKISYTLLDGLPITAQMLESCGFEYKHNHNADGDEIEWLEHEALDWITYRNGEFHRGFGSIRLDNLCYFHQLQNLFYALTGTELSLEPPN